MDKEKLNKIENLAGQLVNEYKKNIFDAMKRIKKEQKKEKAEKIKKNREIHREYMRRYEKKLYNL